ncbi:TSUP family transporter [Diaphorobacter ruginosibacter]|uniref:Probable membrane transporter protein n=2 Tax=Diaphorobacter ruginosibacter TaxID=1715720 RepID=A0A7G9RND2_9BURK|nr:TSUP family transporter [Diaphorobacter ruginosibacter]
MEWSSFFMLLIVVALASACQNLTGFAFALIFVGLAGALHLLPIADAANVAGLLSLVNGVVYLRSHPFKPRWDLLKPMLISSQIGVLLGLGLLHLLSGSLVNILRMLLGVTIIACAVLLLSQKGRREQPSGTRAMYVAGGLSGLLGGLFSTSGPPIVYHLYREPLPAELIRQCLLVLFLANTVLRLGIVISTGELNRSSVIVAAFAMPVVAGVTWVLAKHPPRLPVRVLQWLVCSLLLLAGVSMLLSALR